MKQLKILASLCVLFVMVVFAVSNNLGVPVRFWGYSILGSRTADSHSTAPEIPQLPDKTAATGGPAPRTLPLYLWLFGAFGCGYLACWGIGLFEFHRLKREIRRLNKVSNGQTKEIEKLRIKPIISSEQTRLESR